MRACVCHTWTSYDALKRKTTDSYLPNYMALYPRRPYLDMFVLTTVTLKYKGRLDESRRGHTLRGPCCSSMLYYGCKIVRYCCYPSLKRNTLSQSAASYRCCCFVHAHNVKNRNYAKSYLRQKSAKGKQERNGLHSWSLLTYLSLNNIVMILGDIMTAHALEAGSRSTNSVGRWICQ
jgi:hypothetical protein